MLSLQVSWSISRDNYLSLHNHFRYSEIDHQCVVSSQAERPNTLAISAHRPSYFQHLPNNPNHRWKRKMELKRYFSVVHHELAKPFRPNSHVRWVRDQQAQGQPRVSFESLALPIAVLELIRWKYIPLYLRVWKCIRHSNFLANHLKI